MRQTAIKEFQNSKSLKRFSLKTKSTFVVILLLAGISLIQATVVYQYQQQQKQDYVQSKRTSFEDNLSKQLDLSFKLLASLAQQTSSLQRNAQNFVDFKVSMQQNWVDLKLAWNLTSLAVYSQSDSDSTLELGSIEYQKNRFLIEKAFDLNAPQKLIRCSKNCFMVVAVPFSIRNEQFVAVILKSVDEVFNGLADTSKLNIALLFRKKINDQVLDQIQTSTSNQNEIFQEILNNQSAKIEKSKINELLLNGYSYHYWLSPLKVQSATEVISQSNIDPWLITVFDTSEQKQQRINFWNQVVIILLSTLILSAALFLWLVMKPIRKIALLTDIYPALASREFKTAKNLLPVKCKRYPDEIDSLFEKTGSMIESLIELDSSIIRKESELEYLASHDELTGLGNRNMLRYAVERLMKELAISTRYWALIYIDLDNFKQVNDSLGHESGDALLCQVAKRLKQSVRSHDQVMRLGGDEFTILVDYLNSRNEVTIILQKIYQALSTPVLINGVKISVEFSAGAFVSNDNALSLEDIIKRSDLAMYQAKADGKNVFRIFEDTMLMSAERTFLIINEFDRSIDAEHFSLVFQPQFNTVTLELVGFEALVRWHHPKHGTITPYEFIPLLEESERICLLGRFVAENSIKAHANFLQYVKDIQMSINISPRQLYDEKFISFLLENCNRRGVSTGLVELEMTEHSIVRNFAHAKQWMDEIIKLGFKMAIDDFGTGYSSLSSLNKLFFNSVKLDRSFISGMENSIRDKELLASVISLVSRIDSKIIAEGVELVSQHQYLRDIHCHWVQGYLFAKPVTYDELIPMLEEYKNTGLWPTIDKEVVKQ